MSSATETVVRFSAWLRVQHALVILLFGVLMVTGLPQKWPDYQASRFVVDLCGGIFAARFWHRMAGLVFVAMLVVHLVSGLSVLARRKAQPDIFFTRKDFTDAIHNIAYYLGRRPSPPQFGRFAYGQKFEYWGLVFGAIVMSLSGLILYFPIAMSRILPAELIPVARVFHSNEALLAFLIVLVWHMYSAHLSPEVFPMDNSIFTGRISRERAEREHPLEKI